MVNVFVPYDNIYKIATCLDDKRLYKQIVECKQILTAIDARHNSTTVGFMHHPAVDMWLNHKRALILYQSILTDEWLRRRYPETHALMANHERLQLFKLGTTMPDWWGDLDIHDSHKSMLQQKDLSHYQPYFDIVEDIPYIWVDMDGKKYWLDKSKSKNKRVYI